MFDRGPIPASVVTFLIGSVGRVVQHFPKGKLPGLEAQCDAWIGTYSTNGNENQTHICHGS